MRSIIRFLYRARYGIRGAIKPPINWNRANSLWYRWRYRMWHIEESVYRWTGLPRQWEARFVPNPEWRALETNAVPYAELQKDGSWKPGTKR